MSTEVNNETEFAIDLDEFVDLAAWVFQELHVSAQAELSIIFVGPEVMTDLHRRWMGLDGPTDVMSFPMDELQPGTAQNPTAGMLGDIVICPAVATLQAQDAGHSIAEELLLLATHGILHLLGFDHAEPEEEKEMFALQKRLLLTFLANR